MIKKWVLFLVTMLVLLTSLVTLCGCHEYKTFTFFIEDEIHFSFEYPAKYSIVDSGIDAGASDIGSIYLAVLELETEGREGINTIIEFGVTQCWIDPKEDIAFMLESNLSSLSERKDCKLLERSTVTVAGVEGEAIVYIAPGPVYRTAPAKRLLLTYRRVFFTYDGESWLISVRSGKDSVSTNKIIFEHLLNTLKILD